MQEKADRHASREMAGWVEEVCKALGGLQSNDIGRLLNACFGLSWGLTNVMRVQRGVLISGENASYEDVLQSIGHGTEWARLSRLAFGIADSNGGPIGLQKQARAGLRLYTLSADLLDGVLLAEDRVIVDHACQLIHKTFLDEQAR